MLKLAAVAFLPVAAVLFGGLAIGLSIMPGLANNFEVAAGLYYGAAALSFVLAAPVSWLIARLMLTRRERRLLDAHAGVPRAV